MYIRTCTRTCALPPLQAVELLASAQRLGLNTVRFFAFVDGAGRSGALQLAPGILDEVAMR